MTASNSFKLPFLPPMFLALPEARVRGESTHTTKVKREAVIMGIDRASINVRYSEVGGPKGSDVRGIKGESKRE